MLKHITLKKLQVIQVLTLCIFTVLIMATIIYMNAKMSAADSGQ